ncbi:MAG: DUF1501 domain-containing protein [Woeseiaceae bacterium]|jgi:uncharacterized protein (DUF1501 family)|nr:DUF1501 domain-containing protein [Woeseiaceae bacterium]
MKPFNRREFLKASGAAATLAATPGLAFSQVVGGVGPFADYRALVCVFLFGGNDSFNMLVPRSSAEYDVYAGSRQNLAIPRDDLLPITAATPDGSLYGLHPSMAGLQALFGQGRAAFVTNVGPLIQPVTRETFFNGSATLPPQLFSHNDQQDQWNSLRGNAQSKTGWAGRMADLIRTGVAGQRMATNASLFGANLLQSAEATVAYVMGPQGPVQFEGFSSDPGSVLYEQRQAFLRVLAADYGSVYERAFAEVQSRAIEAADTVTAAIENAPTLGTPFPQSQLGAQLQTVARLIAVRDELEMQRQIFFVAAGGFDSHDNQNEDQPGLLGGVSDAIAAFYAATAELGVAEQVTTFTQSDFGRTLTSNGDGTDHAWGGNQVVVGGAVRGGDLYGRYPLLAIDGDDDVGGGRMIPSTSADQYAATLARWFGIPEDDLGIVAPHIDNFAVRDLGFMV